jgi:hypothetical protein
MTIKAIITKSSQFIISPPVHVSQSDASLTATPEWMAFARRLLSYFTMDKKLEAMAQIIQRESWIRLLA